MEFVNRTEELERLEQIYQRDVSQMVVLYGRRRIGKTALVTQWIRQHPDRLAVYWVAHKSSPELLLEKFSKALLPCLPGVTAGLRFPDWESALTQLFSLAEKQKLVVAIDELPYLLESVPEFPSILQMVWDRYAGGSQLMLILTGSHYHMMYREFNSGKSPLYGRSTADMLLEEIAPSEIGRFLPRYSPTQIVETYSIIGGVPKYLEMWDDRMPVLKNIETTVLSPVTIFRQEAVFLIQDEIPEPRTYLAILEAIGRRLVTPSEISRRTGVAINHVGKYLKTLLDLGFVRRVLSTDICDRTNSRRGRYELKDAYLRFYFHYIYPNLELIEQKRIARMMEIIRTDHDAFVGRTAYEELARRLIVRLGDEGGLSFVPDYVGRIWNARAEIDVAAIQRKTRNVLLGECRWSRNRVNAAVLDALIRKATLLDQLSGYSLRYALFSRQGFTADLEERARREHVLLFEGPDFKPVFSAAGAQSEAGVDGDTD